MRRAAEGHDGKDGDRYGEERRQMQDNAATPNITPLNSCVATTKTFFVRKSSRKGSRGI